MKIDKKCIQKKKHFYSSSNVAFQLSDFNETSIENKRWTVETKMHPNIFEMEPNPKRQKNGDIHKFLLSFWYVINWIGCSDSIKRTIGWLVGVVVDGIHE